MSLLPLNTLSEAGCLFIEARLLGGPSNIVSQIGLTVDAPNTSIAVFSRTSGVLLVAGVGSFFAYRVASNLLGNRFVWECLDARHIDQLPTADRRLLYSFNETEEEDDEEEETDPVTGERRRRQRRDSGGSRISIGQVSVGRLNRIRRSTRTPRGLLGSLQETPRKRAGIVSRQSSRHSVASGHSVASIPFSSNSSVKSASFRIVWEGSQPAWDDFDIPSTSTGIPQSSGDQPSVLSRLGHVASTSSMRRFEDGQSVGDLCSVFNDVMSVTSLAEGNDDSLLMDEEYRDEHDDSSGIWRKCTADNTKYMYQSIVIGSSEVGSEDGGSPKKRQFLELGIANDEDDEKTEQLTLLSPPDSESVMSHSHNSKSRSMYDSAIGAEISSSEEGSTCPKRLYVLREADNISIVAPSCASLEWCDDLDRNVASRLGFEEEKVEGSPLRLRRANLDWDLESDIIGPHTTLSAASSSVTREIEPKFAPKSSRDLMVMACEMFQPYSPPFRDLQTIYHKRRLKRIAVPNLPESNESCVALFMRSALYHKCSLLRDATWSMIEKRFDNAINECDFMNKWPGYAPKTMRKDLKKLHELASSTTESSSSYSSDLDEDHHKAYQVLMVLEAKRAYDERLAGLFCEDWFDVDSPADVFRILSIRGDDELPPKILWNILCRISGVSIEIIDARGLSERPKLHKFSSSASPISTPCLTWLRLGNRPVPLFYIPDDE